ncbi:hypothetical protein LEP1GSC116_0606 [Leptospira interrogans serovar Icterohaemorrhagiae str. Verdun HP]|uniref:Uncharacterized protein n=1 Tax=Leptospira interrogans serovar Icterohaemorrhagiae str. Verdun HP TaxID=1049910 RepID=M6RCC9_LEPIR|nr:hypothetical protein LEP1GSC116_0606 [Leptospira interrogans serovar Icterohaemorrhagiae str. Verdun HP]
MNFDGWNISERNIGFSGKIGLILEQSGKVRGHLVLRSFKL